MGTDADIIITGAGPAGSIAAFELARRGVSVLIIEKSVFPRYKVCGAGLTHKILQEIPFDISPILETHLRSVVFSRGFKDVFVRSSDVPLIHCTMRGRLDAFLLEKAVNAGARVSFDEKVTEVRQERDHVMTGTDRGRYHSRILIGADGAASVTGRMAGLRENIMPGLAWEAEVLADPETVKAFAGTLFLDWGAFPGGYGWVFPKKDHFSIGVGGPASLSKWMIPYYRRFTEYLEHGISDFGFRNSDFGLELTNSPVHQLTSFPNCGIKITNTLSLKSWPIPVRVKQSAFHKGRVLVTGDAGGLTDPLTGEGIYHAVRSGKLAAEACSDHLRSGMSLERYSDRINRELMPELLEAGRIRNIFGAAPLRIHYFVRDSERGWRAFGKILRGERWYADVRKGFGKWQFLWGVACKVSQWICNRKEKKFRKRGL